MHRTKLNHPKSGAASVVRKGFTIVELLIVVVVIAILASIAIVSYNGITSQAKDAALKSNLATAATKLNVDNINNGIFPASSSGLDYLNGFNYERRSDTGFCLSGSSNGVTFYVTSTGSIVEGECPPVPAIVMQTVTIANCPTSRTMAVDARDNHTYWIQKLPDGKCWMLTNLSYAGGGVGTYGDSKVIQNGTADATASFTIPKYYVFTGANPTVNPTQPSLSVDGGDTNPQYGHLYNWCAAMGAQLTTAACNISSIPLPDISSSLCPAGWRLPTGQGVDGELILLNSSVNGGLTNTDSGLRSAWLVQRAGRWSNGLVYQGSDAYYWSTTVQPADGRAYLAIFKSNSLVIPATNFYKSDGMSVRCVANV